MSEETPSRRLISAVVTETPSNLFNYVAVDVKAVPSIVIVSAKRLAKVKLAPCVGDIAALANGSLVSESLNPVID